MRRVFSIENRLIQSIVESREKMVRSFALRDLGAETADLVDRLYFRGEAKGLRGSLAERLVKGLKKKREAAAEKEAQVLKRYTAETAEVVEKFCQLKERVVQQFFTELKEGKRMEILGCFMKKDFEVEHPNTLL